MRTPPAIKMMRPVDTRTAVPAVRVPVEPVRTRMPTAAIRSIAPTADSDIELLRVED
jgi:hypothetical protein